MWLRKVGCIYFNLSHHLLIHVRIEGGQSVFENLRLLRLFKRRLATNWNVRSRKYSEDSIFLSWFQLYILQYDHCWKFVYWKEFHTLRSFMITFSDRFLWYYIYFCILNLMAFLLIFMNRIETLLIKSNSLIKTNYNFARSEITFFSHARYNVTLYFFV